MTIPQYKIIKTIDFSVLQFVKIIIIFTDCELIKEKCNTSWKSLFTLVTKIKKYFIKFKILK